MQLDVFALSIKGRRANNEDAICAHPELGLFVVADGMGGYEGGEIAHVGDGRAYRLRDGVLAQMTVDHSLLAQLTAAGMVPAADFAWRHPLAPWSSRAGSTVRSERGEDSVR